MSTLIEIKRLINTGKYQFTNKALNELRCAGLTVDLVLEAIINAPAIYKRIVSHDPRSGVREYLYVIIGQTYSGLFIYTKGKIQHSPKSEQFYILISSKRDVNF